MMNENKSCSLIEYFAAVTAVFETGENSKHGIKTEKKNYMVKQQLTQSLIER